MKKILLFALPLLAMIAVSCQKDNKGQEGNPSGLKLVKEIKTTEDYDGWEDICSFEYDAQGRLTKYTQEAWHYDYYGNTVYTYEYSDNTITITEVVNYDLDDCRTYTNILNDDGYIVRHTGTEVVDYYYYLAYKNGYIYSYESTIGRDTHYLEWADGNVVDENGVEYTDYVNTANIEFSVINDYFYGGTLSRLLSELCMPVKHKGLYNKNLIKRLEDIEFSYEFDSEGYPIKIDMISTRDNNHCATTTITYYE